MWPTKSNQHPPGYTFNSKHAQTCRLNVSHPTYQKYADENSRRRHSPPQPSSHGLVALNIALHPHRAFLSDGEVFPLLGVGTRGRRRFVTLPVPVSSDRPGKRGYHLLSRVLPSSERAPRQHHLHRRWTPRESREKTAAREGRRRKDANFLNGRSNDLSRSATAQHETTRRTRRQRTEGRKSILL